MRGAAHIATHQALQLLQLQLIEIVFHVSATDGTSDTLKII